MSNSKIKILRDELAKVIAEIQKIRVLNGKLTHALDELFSGFLPEGIG